MEKSGIFWNEKAWNDQAMVRFRITPYIPLQKLKIDWRGAGKTERETTDIGDYPLCLSMQILSFSSFKPASVDVWPVAFVPDQYVQRP